MGQVRPRAVVGVALAAVAAVLLSGCNGSSREAAHAGPGASGTPAAKLPAAISVSPADTRAGLRPDATITVSAPRGALGDVTVRPIGGAALAGTRTADGRWISHGPLAPSTTYQIDATAKNDVGAVTTYTTFVHTLTPKAELQARVLPLDGSTVGVGLPIVVYFTAPVQDRAKVERRLSVTMSTPVEGSWHWFGSKEVHFRPKDYWPVGEHVTLRIPLNGIDVGDNVWGVQDRKIDFSVGDSHVSLVDAQKHTMTVWVNGKVARVIKVSTGRDKYPTASGVHVVLSKTQDKIMDSATVGIPRNSPDGYYEHVFWSTRISWSGEFVHAAPWSVKDQGTRNVSHGCVNASTADAQWFFNLSRLGDIVNVIGTPKPLAPGNGYTDWNVSWANWQAGSALHG